MNVLRRLNNQLRDAQGRIAGDKLERRGWDEARTRLERDLPAAGSEGARLQGERERRARAAPRRPTRRLRRAAS